MNPQSTLRIEELIAELKSRLAIVIVTHNMQQAARVSDYTAFFTIENEGEPGRLIETGPTARIFASPRNPRTRGLRVRPLGLSAADVIRRRRASRRRARRPPRGRSSGPRGARPR